MNNTDIERILSKAHKTIDESKKVMSLYDEQEINENPLFSTLSQIAGNIGVNVKSIASTIGGFVKGFAKGSLATIRALFPDLLAPLVSEWRVSADAMERATNAGVPEGLLAAPCAWWLVDLSQGGLDPIDANTILGLYDNGQGSNEWKRHQEMLEGLLNESADADATSAIISEWMTLGEGLSDYQEKPLPNWLLTAAERATGPWGNFLESDRINIENVAYLIISTQLKGDDEKDDPLLAAIFAKEPTDKQTSFRKKLADKAEQIFEVIVGIHAKLKASGKEGGLRDKVAISKFSTRLAALYPAGKKTIESWRNSHKKEEKEFDDFDGFVEFLKKTNDEDEDDRSKGKSKERIDTDLSPRELCMKMFSDSTWYIMVDAKIGQDQAKRIDTLITTTRAALGNELANVQSMERLSDLITASSEIKQSFDAFAKSDPELEQYVDYANENADEEIGSRLIAMFRPAFTSAFIDFIKSDFKLGGPKLNQLVDQAKPLGYTKEEDPMWARWETTVEEKMKDLIAGFEEGLATLETQAKKAETEIGQIMNKKAEESEADEQEVDVEV